MLVHELPRNTDVTIAQTPRDAHHDLIASHKVVTRISLPDWSTIRCVPLYCALSLGKVD